MSAVPLHLAAEAARVEEEIQKPFPPMTVEEFLKKEFPAREQILGPWLAARTLNMIFAWRGMGKSWIAQAIALAVASGGLVFAKAGAGPAWGAMSSRKVLLIDGEMAGPALKTRFASLIVGGDYQPDGRLRVLSADLFDDPPLPSISSREGQAVIESHLGDAELVVFDNVSTLFRGLDENDASEWDAVQDFLLSLRRRGLAVLLVHHGGKGGAQRGTSKREDVLDTVISLRRPDDYDEAEGARFRVVFEKARGLSGRDVESFEAQLVVEKGAAKWVTSDIRDELDDEIEKLKRAGKTQREIAKKVGIVQSNVARRLKRLARRKEDADAN